MWRERCARAVSTVLEARPQCSRRFSSLSSLFRIGRSLSAWVSDAAERRGCLAALSRALGLPCSYRDSRASVHGFHREVVLAKVVYFVLNEKLTAGTQCAHRAPPVIPLINHPDAACRRNFALASASSRLLRRDGAALAQYAGSAATAATLDRPCGRSRPRPGGRSRPRPCSALLHRPDGTGRHVPGLHRGRDRR